MYRSSSLLAACAALLFACGEPDRGPVDTAATATGEPSISGVLTEPVNQPQVPPAAPRLTEGTASYRKRADISEQELGVPIYPGAKSLNSGTWSLTDALSEGAESLTSIRLRTADGIEKVAAFYRQRMRPDAGQSFEFQDDNGKTISLTTDAGGRSSANVTLRQERTGTRIDINVMGVKQGKDS